MVARDGVEPPTPAFSGILNNLSDFRWPPKYLRSRERHANRGLKSWVQTLAQKAPQPRQKSAVSPSTTQIDARNRRSDAIADHRFLAPAESDGFDRYRRRA